MKKKRRSKIDNNKIIQMFLEVHKNLYDYSLVDYKTMHHKVIIICYKHGNFEQTPNQHYLKKCGCPKCSFERNALKQKDNTKNFIEKAIKIHGNLYNYSLVNYGKNAHEDITILCNIHGQFKVTPNEHLHAKYGCQECALIKRRKTTEEFILQSKKIHGDKYDYSLTNYISNNKKVRIIKEIMAFSRNTNSL
jgi:hypothetical protein